MRLGFKMLKNIWEKYKFFFNDIIFGKNSEFFKVRNGNNKNKNVTQDFRVLSVGRERANKQFFFWSDFRPLHNRKPARA